ncbi:MAG: shikimate kinase [Magnetococcales bacterium]|nr:shikimate kinase [Magnetococcales bacterium]
MNNIIVIGMRGAGKSNIARRLAVMTKRDVLAMDLLISYEAEGRSIPEILEAHDGDWRAFRDLEHAVAQKVATMEGVIIDCGGGVVVDLDDGSQEIYSHRKMDLLKASGTVVWLKGDIERLAARVSGDASRPSLSATQDAQAIMQRRLPFYQQAAHWTLDIEGRTRKSLAREIQQRLVPRT